MTRVCVRCNIVESEDAYRVVCRTGISHDFREKEKVMPLSTDAEVVGYIELKPNTAGMFHWIAQAVYPFNAKKAREIFFAGWPELTESHFQDVIAGKYTIMPNGSDVKFDD